VGEGHGVLAGGQGKAGFMGPFGVVAPAVLLDVEPGIGQRQEPVLVQALVPEFPVEAFDVGVLDGLTRLDELQGHVMIGGSGVEVLRSEFAAVVERQPVGQAAGVPDVGEYVDHGRGGEAVRDPDRETFPRAGVDDGETPKAPAVRELIADEVDAPAGVGRVHGEPRDARHRQAFPIPAPDGQVFEPVEPLHSLVVDGQSVTAEAPVQAGHAPPGIRRRQLTELGPERGIPQLALGHVPHDRSLEPQGAAGPALAHGVRRLDPLDHRPALGRGHPSFPNTSFRICRLRAWSATRRFSRRFSSSSVLSRRASLTCRSP